MRKSKLIGLKLPAAFMVFPAAIAISGCGKSQPAPPSPASAPSTMLPPAVLSSPATLPSQPPATEADGPGAITAPQAPTPPITPDVMQSITPNSQTQAQAQTLLQEANADVAQSKWHDASDPLKKLDAMASQLPQPMQDQIQTLHKTIDPMMTAK